jgi:hypothetical protein
VYHFNQSRAIVNNQMEDTGTRKQNIPTFVLRLYLDKVARDTKSINCDFNSIVSTKPTRVDDMNKTSHTDEPFEGDDGYNQSPNPNSNALTTNQDFNGLVNSRAALNGDSEAQADAASNVSGQIASDAPVETANNAKATYRLAHRSIDRGQPSYGGLRLNAPANPQPAPAGGDADHGTPAQRLKKMFITVGSFVGPGFMVSVAYSM